MSEPRPRPAARRGMRLATVAVLAVAGLLLATSAVTSRGTDLRAEATDLRDLIGKQAQRVGELTAQVADLQGQVQDLAAQGDSAALAVQRNRTIALAPAAGFTAVVGPSVTVSLDDAPTGGIPGAGQGNPRPDDLVVHQQDVQAVVNAMWQGGASAMRIMDQRIISTSAVRCVGNTLLLQGRVYSPPFVITAVGDRAGMIAALDADPVVSIYREFVALYGLGYDVSEDDATTLPPYEGALTLSAATPAKAVGGAAS